MVVLLDMGGFHQIRKHTGIGRVPAAGSSMHTQEQHILTVPTLNGRTSQVVYSHVACCFLDTLLLIFWVVYVT